MKKQQNEKRPKFHKIFKTKKSDISSLQRPLLAFYQPTHVIGNFFSFRNVNDIRVINMRDI